MSIYDILGVEDIDGLNDKIIQLLDLYPYTSKDSINYLIEMLEELKEEY